MQSALEPALRSVPADRVDAGASGGHPREVLNRERWERKYAAYLRVSDALVVVSAVAAAAYLVLEPVSEVVGRKNWGIAVYSGVVIGIWLVCLAVSHARSPKVIATGVEEYRRIGAASLWALAATLLVELLVYPNIPRQFIGTAFPIGALGLLASHWAWCRYVQRARCAGGYRTSVLAIGSRVDVVDLVAELTRNPCDGYHVVAVGIIDDAGVQPASLAINGQQIPVVGGEEAALAAISEYGADTVALTGTEHLGTHGVAHLIWKLEPMGVDLMVSPGVLDVARSRLLVRPIAGLRLLHIEKPQYQGAGRFGKRTFDCAFAIAALVLAGPLIALAAVAVKLDSRGPVFYRAERIGLGGAPFRMLKLRTMVQDADQKLPALLSLNENDGLLFKMQNDPRVTRVGRILRRFSIDELPQFMNVLLQDMSVVGPRPALEREVAAYDSDVRRRLLIKPGITGLWQVSGRSDLSWADSVRLDLAYVDNWSMARDLAIIARTLRAVFTKRGAY